MDFHCSKILCLAVAIIKDYRVDVLDRDVDDDDYNFHVLKKSSSMEEI